MFMKCPDCKREVDFKKTYDGDWECPACGSTFELEDEDEDEDEERISVYDAAEIWASHGKDEDYMFGYDEDELENAL